MTPLDQMRSRARQHLRGGRINDAIIAYSGILEMAPGDFEAAYNLGKIMAQRGRLEDARKLLQDALKADPTHAEAWVHHGMALQHLGRTDDAVASYERALGLSPAHAEALFCLAVTQKTAGRDRQAIDNFNRFIRMRGSEPAAFLHRGDLQRRTGNFSAALADYETALTLKPDLVEGWMNCGALLFETGRLPESLTNYDRALALAPSRSGAWYNRGVILEDLGRDAEALEAYEQAARHAPDLPDAWNSRGNLLCKMGKVQEALADFERALVLDPRHLPSLDNQGAALTDLRRFEEALASYDRALAAAPENADGWYNRGAALQNLGRSDEALAAYAHALALNPHLPLAWNNHGSLLRAAGRPDEALDSFARALALAPGLAGALANAGAALQDLKRYAEAAQKFRELELVAPDHKYLLTGLLVSAQAQCDWPVLEALVPRFGDIETGKAIVPPFTLLGLSSQPALHRAAGAFYLQDHFGSPPACPRPVPASHPKIRLAYVSNDFHAHVTARLMVDLFERHDREQFEVVGISYGPDEKTEMRDRLKKAFDKFHDVRELSDGEIATLMKDLEIDIAIDLKGHTEAARPGIFALRPAPVQVNYLGYPGTCATEVMDYVIADPVVLPFDQQPFYPEHIVHLPDSYQVTNPAQIIGKAPSRRIACLPDKAFVFCCFNNHWKITAPIFEVWMRLLEAVPDSVLWLLDDSANDNLSREAQKRGIDPARLIFAPKLEHDAHLGRLGLADLVLDTLPYNAHTTASDALWTGVPLVTVMGETFAGRVAASLLTAIGLPELIARDLQSYEELALTLAHEPEKHRALRHRLAEKRLSAPLFDADRFRRSLEAAFTTMAETARRFEPPKSFAVPA